MFNDFFSEVGETLKELPSEIGTEAWAQVKGSAKQNQASGNSNSSSDASRQSSSAKATADKQFLQDLYGTSQLTPQQAEVKRQQDLKIQTNRYRQIQQDIQEYRAKKQQEKTKYEIGWQPFEATARTQVEEMEMWEVGQKKAEERKKKEQEQIRLPGSAQARSGEQGKIMG